MSTLTIEQPRRRSHARAAVRRNRAPQAETVLAPRALSWDEATELVRGVLSFAQLEVAISHAAPAKYGEIRATLRGMAFQGPSGATAVAEHYAVKGLMDLGILAVRDQAEAYVRQLAGSEGSGPLVSPFGGARRRQQIVDLAFRITSARWVTAWENSPAEGTAVMPVRERATRYPVAPGLTATADEMVSVVYGYWMNIESPDDWREPVITGEIDTWFRALVHRLWTYDLTDYGPDGEPPAERRERRIRVELEGLAHQLEHGEEVAIGAQVKVMALTHPATARLRFIEHHLARAFGFYGYDARTRHARQDIGDAPRPYRLAA